MQYSIVEDKKANEYYTKSCTKAKFDTESRNIKEFMAKDNVGCYIIYRRNPIYKVRKFESFLQEEIKYTCIKYDSSERKFLEVFE